MESEKFLSVLRQALEQVYDSIDTYTKYMQLVEDPEIKKAMARMVRQKQTHLDLLRQIGESARTSAGIPEETTIAITNEGGLNVVNLGLLLKSLAHKPERVPEKTSTPPIPEPVSVCSQDKCNCANKPGIKSAARLSLGNHKKRICISNRFY